ncbi:MAG: PadR family transcriptional regulator [Candidatus Thorarchaeota archaeon]|nr:PadR family transcriptional regulator [Candidatus Thorarchaeota archaeon]
MPDEAPSVEKDKPKAIGRLVDKLTKEMLWIYILRLLQERPHYGYELKELVSKRFGFAPATVSGYAIIYRLIKDGLIEEQHEDGSPRKYYGITDRGRRAMHEAKMFLVTTMEKVFDLTE